mgnify:CR=1 FL=1
MWYTYVQIHSTRICHIGISLVFYRTTGVHISYGAVINVVLCACKFIYLSFGADKPGLVAFVVSYAASSNAISSVSNCSISNRVLFCVLHLFCNRAMKKKTWFWAEIVPTVVCLFASCFSFKSDSATDNVGWFVFSLGVSMHLSKDLYMHLSKDLYDRITHIFNF